MTDDASTDSWTFESAETLAQGVAEWLCALAEASGRDFAVCLSGGSTPRRLYERLAMPAIASRFPWSRAHWFWCDERFVPHNRPDSNYRMAHDTLLSRVPIPNDNVHAIPTENFSPEQAAVEYEMTLKGFHGADVLSPDRPLFDVTLLGIGEDGHTASLFPGQPALQETRRWVVAVIGAKSEPRITLTYPALNSTRDVAFLATGAGKRDVVARPGWRLHRTCGPDTPDRASPLVYGSRCGTGRNRLMSMSRRQSGRALFSAPAVMIVMGVAGSGKSTIGALLARHLHWEFEDADWLHPASNVDKMHSGIPLTDADRLPWLDAVAAWIDDTRRSGGHAVVACSALKRRYRDILIGERTDVRQFCRTVIIRTADGDGGPTVNANGRLSFDIVLKAGEAWHRCLIYDLMDGSERMRAPRECTHSSTTSDHADKMDAWQRTVLKIRTSNEEFYRCYNQGVQDMAALRLPLRGMDHMVFVPAAGLPWFVALFGRDALIVSLQAMIVYPEFAGAALEVLGQLQAKARDDYRDAEPGKILHELRSGELAHFKVIPHTPYYGTADATPLYLVALHAAWRATGDRALLERHLPAAEACLMDRRRSIRITIRRG